MEVSHEIQEHRWKRRGDHGFGTHLIPASARAGGIKKRAENQQDRIAQGIQSGQLTARETARLEHKESQLHSEVRDMRQLDGGKLTAKDRAVVNQQQDRLSRGIFTEKHDAQTQPPQPQN